MFTRDDINNCRLKFEADQSRSGNFNDRSEALLQFCPCQVSADELFSGLILISNGKPSPLWAFFGGRNLEVRLQADRD